MSIDPGLLEMLVCPACREELCLKSDGGSSPAGSAPHNERLVCSGCRRSYPIKDGIPVLLVDEATIEAEESSRQ